MSTCPVCEHVQESGTECEVCGRRLAGDPAGEPPESAPIDDLEPTLAAPAVVDSSLLPDLEPTALAAGASPGANDGPPRSVACRYCGTVAAPGEVFCPTCAVRLPLELRHEQPAGVPEVERRCRSCGTRFGGEVCPGCGARYPQG